MMLQSRAKKRNVTQWIVLPFIIVFFYANTFYFGKTLKDAKIDYSYNTHIGGSSQSIAADGEARAPVHWNSGWIGNQWVPPNCYKLYSAVDMRNYFSNHSILFIGDSTARRQYATLFATLVAPQISDITLAQLDAASVIDVNKNTITENSRREGYQLFRELPAANDGKDHANTNHWTRPWLTLPGVDNNNEDETYYSGLHVVTCLSGLVENIRFLQTELQQLKYSVVVFVLGPWEYSEMFACAASGIGRRNATVAFVNQLKNLTSTYQNTKFIWRTWAGSGLKKGQDARTMQWKNAQAHNHFIKNLIHTFQREQYLASDHEAKWNRISYVDWGMVMGPRSFPDSQRIKGDIPNHFGFEARATFNQMLINHLIELERQETFNLAPASWVMENGDAADDCLHAGFSTYYCVSKEELNSSYNSFLTRTAITNFTEAEIEQLNMARDDFCNNCTFHGDISCGYRLMYMRGNYKMDELSALLDVMKVSMQCNKTSSV